MTAPSRFTPERLVVAAAIPAILVTALIFGQRQARPTEEQEVLEAGQSRSLARSGARGFALLLQHLGFRIIRHERRLDLIPAKTRVLFSIAPRLPLEKEELAGLRSWITRGGTFIWFPRIDDRNAELLHEFQVVWTGDPEDLEEPEEVIASLQSVSGLADGYRLMLGNRRRLEVRDGGPVESLAGEAEGSAITLTRIGKGRAIVFSEPRPARNDALIDGDHDALLVHLVRAYAREGAVAFDEYHHGFTDDQNFTSYLFSSWWGLGLLHAVVLGMLVITGTRRRLGPPVIVHDGRRRRPREFLEAFARLFRSARASGPAIGMVLADVSESLQRRFGTSDLAGLRRGDRSREGAAARAAETLGKARGSLRTGLPPDAFVACLGDLERLRRDLLDIKETPDHAPNPR